MSFAGLPTWPEPPAHGNEVDVLLGSLERQRATFAWKAGGLNDAQLAQRLESSAMSLGGLLRHLAHCENWQFSQRLFNEAPAEPWASDTSWDDDWTLAATETAEVLYARWQFHVDRSRALMTRALANGGLEQSLQRPWPNGATSSLRRLLADLLEEYARHVGHADLLREAIDGVVGEDPPNAFE